MLTRSLAREMGPEVRVNAIAPGAILWPEDENELDIETQQKILQEIPLKRAGSPADIADTILFLVTSDYINGQVIAVDVRLRRLDQVEEASLQQAHAFLARGALRAKDRLQGSARRGSRGVIGTGHLQARGNNTKQNGRAYQA